MLLRGDKNKEHYRITEVLPIKNKYYSFTTIPVCAFITPMSIIYAGDHNDIVVRFKKELLTYAEDFVDEPLEQGDMSEELYELALEKHKREELIRRLTYATEKYKNHPATEFEIASISHRKLEETLDKDEYMEEVYSFTSNDPNPLFNADAYWYPIEIDTIFSGFRDRSMQFWNNAVFARFNGERHYGYLGYDSVFYCIDYYLSSDPFKDTFSEKNIRRAAYHMNPVDNTVYKLETIPEWMNKCNFFSTLLFLKEYIVLPDNTCVNYEGEELEERTKHYKNVDAMNSLIKLFIDYSTDSVRFNVPYLEIKVPYSFETLEVDMIEKLIFPMLESKNCLNDIAAMNFLRLRELFVKIGLATDFATALVNIAEVNKKVSNTDLCGDELFHTLCILEKVMDNQQFIALLNDFDRLQEVM